MTQKDGGPAFPTRAQGETTSGRPLNYEGMSLRDWYIGMSQPLPDNVRVVNMEVLAGRPYDAEPGSIEHWQFVADAEAAWKAMQADAMIARYGRVKVSKIRAAFNALRVAIRTGDIVAANEALDRYEPWADYVFDQRHKGEDT